MRIFGIGSKPPAEEAKRKSKSSGAAPGQFAKHLDSAAAGEGASEGAAAEAAAPASAVGSLLAVQAMSDAPDREARRRQIERGEVILDKLDSLRIGLLEGRVPEGTLAELARTVRERREDVGDPRLASVLDEIELRAEVELAKLSRRNRG